MRRRREGGSITVEFLLGSLALVVTTVALLQMGLYLYARAGVLAAAREGARRAAAAGAGPRVAEDWSRSALRSVVFVRVDAVSASVGEAGVVVRVHAAVPAVSPIGPSEVDVTATVADEDAYSG